jgi:hypothetical protein
MPSGRHEIARYGRLLRDYDMETLLPDSFGPENLTPANLGPENISPANSVPSD